MPQSIPARPRLDFLLAHLSAALVFSVVGSPLQAQSRSVNMSTNWELNSDTWVATDGLGRELSTATQVGARRHDKTVGIFYFLWLGRHGQRGPYDISKILAQDPAAMQKPDSPLWGGLGVPHHWGESIFGYYVSDDDSVLRKHAQMLADAGVDMLVFDVTNQITYPESWQALCRVFDQQRQAGNRVPQIAFLCPFWTPDKVMRQLWEELYSQNRYPELWFRWEGKPLILADPAVLAESEIDDETGRAIRSFFTFRKPQPDYFIGPTGPKQWGWLEVHPQHEFYKQPGVVEQMTVSVAQNALDGKLSVLSNPRAHGRSFHDGQQPAPADQNATGENFAEQWQHALSVDPPFIFITGWNEWIAGRFDDTAPFHGAGPVTFVDQFNQEYSRDIEPMQGGHEDAFYYQMVDFIRQYKGAQPIPLIRPRPISIDGRFLDWSRVTPEFRDTKGDPVKRDYRGWGSDQYYVNQTGRYDLLAAKVSADQKQVYFYLRTAQPRSPAGDPTGSTLWIDMDQNPKTGWLGYDLVVNRLGADGPGVAIERNVGNRYQWTSPELVKCHVAGKELELAITWEQLGCDEPPSAFDFKWTDNIQPTGDWSDFTVNGDAAPNDRFNYRAKLPPNLRH